MKLRKVYAGYYKGPATRKADGAKVEVEVVCRGRNASMYREGGWYWLVDGKGGDDIYATKKEAVEGVALFLQTCSYYPGLGWCGGSA